MGVESVRRQYKGFAMVFSKVAASASANFVFSKDCTCISFSCSIVLLVFFGSPEISFKGAVI